MIETQFVEWDSLPWKLEWTGFRSLEFSVVMFEESISKHHLFKPNRDRRSPVCGIKMASLL